MVQFQRNVGDATPLAGMTTFCDQALACLAALIGVESALKAFLMIHFPVPTAPHRVILPLHPPGALSALFKSSLTHLLTGLVGVLTTAPVMTVDVSAPLTVASAFDRLTAATSAKRWRAKFPSTLFLLCCLEVLGAAVVSFVVDTGRDALEGLTAVFASDHAALPTCSLLALTRAVHNATFGETRGPALNDLIAVGITAGELDFHSVNLRRGPSEVRGLRGPTRSASNQYVLRSQAGVRRMARDLGDNTTITLPSCFMSMFNSFLA